MAWARAYSGGFNNRGAIADQSRTNRGFHRHFLKIELIWVVRLWGICIYIYNSWCNAIYVYIFWGKELPSLRPKPISAFAFFPSSSRGKNALKRAQWEHPPPEIAQSCSFYPTCSVLNATEIKLNRRTLIPAQIPLNFHKSSKGGASGEHKSHVHYTSMLVALNSKGLKCLNGVLNLHNVPQYHAMS